MEQYEVTELTEENLQDVAGGGVSDGQAAGIGVGSALGGAAIGAGVVGAIAAGKVRAANNANISAMAAANAVKQERVELWRKEASLTRMHSF